MNGEYIIKLQDQTTKVKSATAISLVLNIPSAIPKLLVQTRREDTDTPPFQGEKFGCFYSDEYDGLVLDGADTVDDVLLIDDLSEMDFIGERLASGEYEFPALLDLGGKFQVELDRTINSRGLYPSDLIDDRSELVDAWSDWDGTLAEDTNAILYFRSSDEAPAADDILLEATPDFFLLEDGDKLLQESSTEFGDWRVLEKATFVGRTFQFKCELEADHPDQTPLVEELGYQLSIPARTESSATIASGAAAKAVTFTNAFYQAPTVGITAFNLASGDYYEVTSVTRTGFTVRFKNSSNSSVDRNFQYVAAGFGSEADLKMATHDYILANQSGSSFRSDLNNALAAIVSQNSSATEPATTYAYQYWIDTSATPALIKQRNSSNDAWVTLAEVDGQTLIADGSSAKPGIAFASDINTGIRRKMQMKCLLLQLALAV